MDDIDTSKIPDISVIPKAIVNNTNIPSATLSHMNDMINSAYSIGSTTANEQNNNVKPRLSDAEECTSEIGEYVSDNYDCINELAEIISVQQEEINMLKERLGVL